MACARNFNFRDCVRPESVYADLLIEAKGKVIGFWKKILRKNFPHHNKSNSLVKKPRKFFLTKSIIPW
jgi:hypothetical protein